MATLTVGTGQQYATISAAVAASRDGDVVQVQAGTYVNDFATINTKITLQGVGGMVNMVATTNIPGDKGILVTNTDVTIDHFEFSGAKGASGNDAGIRYQGGNLTVTNSYFHDNQNGLLANPNAAGTITIRNSEFDHNGTGDGYTHNLYVGAIGKLTIENSYFHDAVVGHEIKSRALETVITGTRIYDNAGSASYSVDLPNGGKATLTNNVIEQGPNSGNPNIVAFGAEGSLHAGSNLTMTGNTVLNDMGRGAMVWNASGSPVTVDHNQVWNITDSQLVTGGGAATNTTRLAAAPSLDMSHPWSAGAAEGALNWTGTSGDDQKTGGAGDDLLTGLGGQDSLYGGAGADTIVGGEGRGFLRGDDGADSLVGGSDFDDMHGNMGDDTLRGGLGDDWVVGGKDQDVLYGEQGSDIVYGNMGADTCLGGTGDDIVRGGQNDDVVDGGDGADWLSGDRGSDTVTGGAGADIFHSFGDAGLDVVTDFHASEGDRVQLDPGSVYTVAQAGADTVISLTGGAQVVLQGVTLSSLPAGWIFGA